MNFLNILLYSMISTILCLPIIYAYFKNAYKYWARRNVSFIPPTIPFGNSTDQILQRTTIGENSMKYYRIFKQRGLKFGGIFTFIKPVLVIVDPELAKHILAKDFVHFPDRGMYYDEKREPLSAHLIALTGLKWRNLRTIFTPTFTPSKMKMMFQILLNCCKNFEVLLEEHVNNRRPINMKDVTGRFTTDIIGSCAFGVECNSLRDPEAEFRKYSKMLFEPTALEAFTHNFSALCPKLFSKLKLKKFPDKTANFFISSVKNIIKYREENDARRNDFMQLMMNLKHTGDIDGLVIEPGKRLTDEEIAAQTFVFFLAGYETSSTTMTYFLYDMAINQDIQVKVKEEIENMLNKYNGDLTYDGIMELEYLDKAIYESLRMHPPVPFLQRNCSKDYQIPNTNTIIEQDTLVMIPTLGYHLDAEFFPQPEVYDPERFSAKEKSKRNIYAYLPFGEGPRYCIGVRFGMMQIKVGVVTLLKNYRICLSTKTETPLKYDPKCFVLTVKGGIWINAERI